MRGVRTRLDWHALDPVQKAMLVIVSGVCLLVAAGCFVVSYNALYEWISATGMYSPATSRVWALLIDAFIVLGTLGLVLGASLAVARGWFRFILVIGIGLSCWFNYVHAGGDNGRRLAGIIAPVFMFIATEGFMRLFRALFVREAPTDLNPADWREVDDARGGSGSDRYTVRRLPERNASPAELGRQAAARSLPEIGRNGQSPIGDGAKKAAVESYLSALAETGDDLRGITVPEVREALAAVGISVADRTIQPILKTYRERAKAYTNGDREREKERRGIGASYD